MEGLEGHVGTERGANGEPDDGNRGGVRHVQSPEALEGLDGHLSGEG